MIVAYSYFTFALTRWRIHIRRAMNESDNEAIRRPWIRC